MHRLSPVLRVSLNSRQLLLSSPSSSSSCSSLTRVLRSSRLTSPRLSSRLFSVSAVHSMAELRDAVERQGDSGLTVIEWKAAWCSKCKVLAKEIERIAPQHPGVSFLYADIDEADLKDGKKEAGIDHLPVLHFIKGGELVHSILGVRINEMQRTIEQHAGAADGKAEAKAEAEKS